MPVGTDEKNSQKKNFDEKQLVVFKLGKEEFGVDINKVKEIIRWEDVTRIPNTSPYIKGVINLRGSIIVVNDLAMKLGLSSKEIDNDTRILVVEVGDNTVGMIVDSATEVLRLEGEKIRDAPSMITSTIDHNYIEGVGLLDEKRLLTLLDLGKVLESKDFEKIWQAQQMAQQNVQEVKKQYDKKEPKQEKKLEIKSPENLNKNTDLEPKTSQLSDEEKTPVNIETKDDDKKNKNQSNNKTSAKSKKDNKL